MPKKVALIQGGMSSEREVSLKTGAAMEKALIELGVEYCVLDANAELLDKLQKEQPNLALIALHGKYGEDGIVQGICEFLKIPYTGSGVLASALLMDKVKTKEILVANNIPTPKFQVIDTKKEKQYDLKLPLPVVIKPSRDGSSVGVSIVKEQHEVAPAILEASKWDHRVLVEEFIVGAEVTVTVLNGKALPSIEIVPNEHFYDYEHKYTKGKTNYIIPAKLDSDAMKKVNEYAEFLFQCFQLRGYARVDFMIKNRQHPFVLEVNTLPGMTETSLVPQSAKAKGMTFAELVKEILDTASLDYENLS